MKRRLIRCLLSFSIILSFAVAFTISLVDYEKYKKSEMLAVKRSCEIVASILNSGEDEDIFSLKTEQTRVTLVMPSGKVIFDTDASIDSLGNHKDRTEIANAMKKGTGESLRHSDSIGKLFYYYAIKLDSGNILRVSQSFMGAGQSVLSLIPYVLLFVIIFAVISVFIVNILTKHIVAPINNSAKKLDELLTDDAIEFDEMSAYEEFIPFIKKISTLNEDIRAYAIKLKEQTERLEAIAGNMQEGLIVIDNSENILSINNGATKVLRINDGRKLIGKHFLNACRDNAINEAIHKSIKTGKSIYIDKESMHHFYKYFFSPVLSENGECKGLIIFIINMTAEMMNEQLRRDFATNVSHELKTPLTSIAGFAEMLKSKMISAPDEVVKTSSIIYRESSRLITLVEEIIRLSQIESGKSGEREKLDLKSTVNETLEAVEHSAEQRHVTIKTDCESAIINANRSSMYELIYNLCDNAIKYNKENGEVSVSLKSHDNVAELIVSDTGIGIPHEHLDRVFERFYRVDKSRSKQTGGTGLGLSIVKHIVEEQKGHISIDSTQEKGTTIKVTLPLE